MAKKTIEGGYIKNGKRNDGRKVDQMRDVKMEVGVLKRADGSARVQMGGTIAIAAVYGPRKLHPKHLQDADTAIIRCRYQMMPFSVDERIRPGPDRRGTEISKVTRESLEPAMMLEEFPRAGVDVFIQIMQADAGTRCAGINAASLALADAGLPMRDLVTAVAAGQVEGTPVLDLNREEEDLTDCDVPVAYMAREKKITLLQTDGDVKAEDYKKIIKLAVKGCEQLHEIQRAALKKKYAAAAQATEE
jgi:exosome complex component RRP41